jgi:hypothetical protein
LLLTRQGHQLSPQPAHLLADVNVDLADRRFRCLGWPTKAAIENLRRR